MAMNNQTLSKNTNATDNIHGIKPRWGEWWVYRELAWVQKEFQKRSERRLPRSCAASWHPRSLCCISNRPPDHTS